MVKLTETWEGFPEQVPAKIRKDIIQMLAWVSETPAPVELLATRALNLYLYGVNDGLRKAQSNLTQSLAGGR